MKKYIVETQNPQEEERLRHLLQDSGLKVSEVTDARILYPELFVPATPEERERRLALFDSAIGKIDSEQAEALKARIYKERDEC